MRTFRSTLRGWRPTAWERVIGYPRRVREGFSRMRWAWPKTLRIRISHMLMMMQMYRALAQSGDEAPVALNSLCPRLPQDDEIARSRMKLLTQENPVGVMLLREIGWINPQLRQFAFEHRVERTATRVLLAIRRFQLSRRKSPSRLEEVASAGLLERLPRDDFAERHRSLGYSAERNVVWSVGPSGTGRGEVDCGEPGG